MTGIFGWFILFWMFFLIVTISIGGYFMFRKFLKGMPKKDGMSTLDWQEYYIKQSLPLWNEEGKALLNKLVAPVPSPFREVAKQTIAAKIGELALREGAGEIDTDLIIRGYIMATPKRDHKWLKNYLDQEGIDYSRYTGLLR
ncbi:conserved hypothetical protein [[Clostridium] ultunense Esp]|uniref:DUF2621 family protein n=1 Tax=Thermicanus aegyptius TaxID=94009 RepID=UPI0002B6FDF9|nr:DUF2621 family protein [Thermicanus aegyptius]CCQ92889.1 conserved hypothetical protein [[Clostridium] ultunense Esp]